MEGHRFGRLTVISEAPASKGGRRWNCRCECGGEITARSGDLRRGKYVSCGCAKKERVATYRGQQITHGATIGGKESPEFTVWMKMRDRCGNPNSPAYRYYGGRGITICERWQSFAAFLEDVGARPSAAHTLDRLENDRGYDPGNVRWATHTEQQRNRRDNVRLTLNGETKCLVEWAEEAGLKVVTVQTRLRRGWSVEDALLTPTGKFNRWTRPK